MIGNGRKSEPVRSRARERLMLLVLPGLLISSPALPSSHGEAPLLVEDPAVDSTDLYVFRSPQSDTCSASETLNIIANYAPMRDPGDGPIWSRLSDQALYEIKIDNDGDAVEDITYQIRFRTEFRSPGGSLLLSAPLSGANLLDPSLRVVQRYTVTRIDKGGPAKVLLRDMPVAPPNTGAFSAPAYPAISDAAVYPLDGDRQQYGQIFVGPRDDPYFADQGAISDLLRVRCAATPNDATGCGGSAAAKKGVDYYAGYTVQTLAIQIPLIRLLKVGAQLAGRDQVLGVWTTASRPRVRILRTPSLPATQGGVRTQDHTGGWVQVSRLGLPLVNTLLVPIALRDYYGTTQPANDQAFFASNVGKPLLTDPELAQVLKRNYAIDVPAAGRTDFEDLLRFQVAIAGTTRAPFRGTEYALTPADIVRIDVSQQPPADLVSNRLGAVGRFLNAEVDNSTGFPNGRRLQDDVLDAMLSISAGVLRAKGVQLGDGVDANERAFSTCFPYLALPPAANSVNVKGGASFPLLHTAY